MKSDLKHEVTYEVADDFAQNKGMKYFEISSKSGNGVKGKINFSLFYLFHSFFIFFRFHLF